MTQGRKTDGRRTDVIEYGPRHLETCAALFLDVFNAPPWNDRWEKESARGFLSEIAASPTFLGFVGLRNGQVISACLGYVKSWWSAREYAIEEFFVDRRLQRQGYGSELLSCVEAEVIHRGIGSITLLTRRSSPAESFYQRSGFLTMESMAFMRKPLT